MADFSVSPNMRSILTLLLIKRLVCLTNTLPHEQGSHLVQVTVADLMLSLSFLVGVQMVFTICFINSLGR